MKPNTKYDFSLEYSQRFKFLNCTTNKQAGGILLYGSNDEPFEKLYQRGYLTGAALQEAKKRYEKKEG